MSDEKATYLFCFARSDQLPEQLEIEGLDPGSRLQQRRAGELAAVVCEVSLEDFTGPHADAHLQDLAWLAPRAMSHERVIEVVARLSPVFPARFGTIFTSLESLDAQLARHGEAIRAFLARTAGAEEWGLKGYLDRAKAQERLVDEELAGGGTAALSASPGMRYMQERRLRAQAETKLSAWLRDTNAKTKEELSHRALETAERKLLSTSPEEGKGEMVLNWSFLVPKQGAQAFLEAVEQLGRDLVGWGLTLQPAGPFPPFSFTPALEEPKA